MAQSEWVVGGGGVWRTQVHPLLMAGSQGYLEHSQSGHR